LRADVKTSEQRSRGAAKPDRAASTVDRTHRAPHARTHGDRRPYSVGGDATVSPARHRRGGFIQKIIYSPLHRATPLMGWVGGV